VSNRKREEQLALERIPVDSPKAKIAALVVNWNTPDDVIRLVESAEEWEPNLRWSFYQNKPPDGTGTPWLEVVKGRAKRVVIQRGKENHGHGYGINRAAEVAREWDVDYYFILNPDCLFTSSILDRLAGFLEEKEERCVVGPKQLDSAGHITAGGIIGTREQPVHRYWKVRDLGNTLGRDAVKCPTVAGSAMLVRADDFHKYGGLLEAKHYYSETWFNYHIQAHGRECWYLGEVTMIHEWHRSSKLGAQSTDGSMRQDQELFRRMCDEHDPPISRD